MVTTIDTVIPMRLVNMQRTFKMFADWCMFREEQYLELRLFNDSLPE